MMRWHYYLFVNIEILLPFAMMILEQACRSRSLLSSTVFLKPLFRMAFTPKDDEIVWAFPRFFPTGVNHIRRLAFFRLTFVKFPPSEKKIKPLITQCRRFKCSSVISWLLEDIVPRVYEHADTALNQDIIALLANRGGVRNPCSKRCENLLLQSLVRITSFFRILEFLSLGLVLPLSYIVAINLLKRIVNSESNARGVFQDCTQGCFASLEVECRTHCCTVATSSRNTACGILKSGTHPASYDVMQ
ncbi:hypothetical protein C0J52_20344, partial [Blattella germanica]